jgi:hypothetical protein
MNENVDRFSEIHTFVGVCYSLGKNVFYFKLRTIPKSPIEMRLNFVLRINDLPQVLIFRKLKINSTVKIIAPKINYAKQPLHLKVKERNHKFF